MAMAVHLRGLLYAIEPLERPLFQVDSFFLIDVMRELPSHGESEKHNVPKTIIFTLQQLKFCFFL